MKKKHNLFAVVEKDSNRAVSIIEAGLKPLLKNDSKVFDILPVSNTGTSSFRVNEGTINTMSVWVDNGDDDLTYYIITDWPDSISLGDAYKLIKD